MGPAPTTASPFSCAQSGPSPPYCSPAGLLQAGESSFTFFCDLLLCSYLFSALYFKTLFFLVFKWDFCSESPLKYPVVCKHAQALLKEGIPAFNAATDTLVGCWPICMSKCPGILFQDAEATVCFFTEVNADFDTQVLRDLGKYL